jgi:cobalt-zinc-cadmium efflux system outer membrane protein
MSVYRKACLWVVFFFCVAARAQAQDTVRITLPEAEKLFLQKNLSLLAERYNIGMAKAEIIQARLYNNPNLSFQGNLYNPDNNKYFDLSNESGQYSAAIQQEIILAGKRNLQVKLAKTNTAIAENAFFDLLRTLRFTLRSDFYKAYFGLNSINAYQTQIITLEDLSATYNALEERGGVTLKDAVRIKSLLYNLKAEQTSLRNDFNVTQAELQLLLQNNNTVFIPVSDSMNMAPPINDLNLRALIDTAYVNRYDLKQTRDSLVFNQQNYSLQKALAVPNLTLGAAFDKRGSFVENASFFNAGIDLPFFNRNQGNIKAASIAIDQSKVRVDMQTQQVENEVQHAYLNAVNTDKMLQSVDPKFRNQFEQLLKSITQNFEKKNISLLEFTDFYESYKENILQLNRLLNDRMQAIELLNFSVGKTVINL